MIRKEFLQKTVIPEEASVVPAKGHSLPVFSRVEWII